MIYLIFIDCSFLSFFSSSFSDNESYFNLHTNNQFLYDSFGTCIKSYAICLFTMYDSFVQKCIVLHDDLVQLSLSYKII